MPTACYLAEDAGPIALVYCSTDEAHEHRKVPVTTAQRHDFVDVGPTLPPCVVCGAPMETRIWSNGFLQDGELVTTNGLKPGGVYWVPCWRGKDGTLPCAYWDNCDGKHLHVVLPNGHKWSIDSRASNCTLPNDRTHRCWVRTGAPPNVTVGKNGHTCNAGAGSILSGDYHGFLRDGVLT